MASLRTPDPNPGWLGDDELALIRRRLPLMYVEAVPVRVDGMGRVTDVGLLLRVGASGSIGRTVVSGRVMYGETLRDALFRHLEKDLGPMAFPQLPASPIPFAVAEYFPTPSPSQYTDERQHAVALNYVVPVTGTCDAAGGGLERRRRRRDGGRPRLPRPRRARLRRPAVLTHSPRSRARPRTGCGPGPGHRIRRG